jgi:2',3'-cyclic-nucleotide 2'-phosphodiesterase (5'-nucleotidase family)
MVLFRALLFSFLLTIGVGSAQDVRKLSILHSNDLHARLLPDAQGAGGWAHLATLVRQERAGCGHCVYVHAGDLVQGTPVSTIFRGVPLYEIGNKLGFDMATLGNHEFDYGHALVKEYLKKAKFPLVTANVVNDSGQLITNKAYVIRKVNGMRVAFVGAVMGNLVSGFLTPTTAGPWKAIPVADTVNRYAQELQDKADLIVVVGHMHQEEGSELLRQSPKVAVVVEGHNHRGRTEAEVVENRIAVGCRANGVELCRLDLEVDVRSRKVVSWKWHRIPVIAKAIAPAKDVAKLVTKWEQQVAKKVDVVIGTSEKEFDQPTLRLLMEQAMREEMGADFAYMNRGGVRDRLPKGTIQARHIWNIMPFDNKMVTARVKGSAVPESLRNGKAVDPGKEYTITMADYTATNEAERKRMGFEKLTFVPTERLLRDLLIDWVRRKKVLLASAGD